MLRLTPTYTTSGDLYLENGLIVFRLGIWDGSKELAHFAVNSGARGLQTRQHLDVFQSPQALPGSNEPIPEGEYKVGGPEHAPGGSWGAGLGPIWYNLSPLRPGKRSAFGIHLDENRAQAPGSAGCIVFPTLKELQRFTSLYSPQLFSELVVDHGLGSVKKAQNTSAPKPPVASSKPSSTGIKMYFNENGAVIAIEETLAPGKYQIFSTAPAWVGKLVSK